MSNFESDVEISSPASEADLSTQPRPIELMEPREVPLGGPRALNVRRTLPQRHRSLIGAWCFLDHYGPAEVGDDRTMHVPPHPHTGLQTVSWLFEGEVEHRDSTGAHQIVRPGELNLMTAGSGVQHSEYATVTTTRMHGVQLWVALPDGVRHMPATFESSQASRTIVEDARALVFVGNFAGAAADATTHSPLVAVQPDLPAGGSADLPLDPSFEHGLLIDSGDVHIDDLSVSRDSLAYVPPGRTALSVRTGSEPARLILIGGTPFGESILMWWNFVGRTHDEIVQFRDQWQESHERFGMIDDPEARLPAPVLPNVRLRPRD